MANENTVHQNLQEAIINGKKDLVVGLIETALKEGMTPEELMNNVMIPSMDVVGDKYSKAEIYLPEMMIAARAMGVGLDFLQPKLLAEGVKKRAMAVIGTIKGDMHDIGKNIVTMILQGSGYELIDLGVDVQPEKFVEAVRQHQPNFVLMSALLTTTMETMGKTIKALQESGLRDHVKVGVGGAPLTQRYANEIGADFYADDARAAVLKCNELI